MDLTPHLLDKNLLRDNGLGQYVLLEAEWQDLVKYMFTLYFATSRSLQLRESVPTKKTATAEDVGLFTAQSHQHTVVTIMEMRPPGLLSFFGDMESFPEYTIYADRQVPFGSKKEFLYYMVG